MRRTTILMLLSGWMTLATAAEPASEQRLNKAVFAGGCFWCMEPPFDALPGVTATVSGYTGGTRANPTYKEVSAGNTGHVEAIEVTYDPAKVSYEQLLEVYWRNIDPLDAGGQFCDRGEPYQTAIFYQGADQKRFAETSKARIEQRLKRAVVTPLREVATFYPAEDYHQDYYQRNPLRYKYYRYRCGRDERLEQLWGKETK